MSIHLMSKAFKCQQVKGSEKFLLLALADNASDNEGEYGTCFPSIRTLTEKTGLSNRAVIDNLEKLIEKGLLLRQYRSRKSGGRSSNKYLIFPSETYDLLSDKDKIGFTQSEESSPLETDTQSEESSHQKPTQSEESSHLINHHSKIIKPSPIDIAQKKPRPRSLDYSSWPELPDQQILDDWLELRKRIRAPVSQTVVNRFGKELHNAVRLGYSVDTCLTEVVTRGWRGFEAQWLVNSDMRNQTNYPNQPLEQSRAGGFIDKHTDTSWAL